MPRPPYPPNTNRWKKGDLVLHYADAKEARMLMRVIGYTRVGDLCKTQYVESDRKRTVLENDIKYLLDPADFLPYWADYPILATEPKRCPICLGKDIDVDRLSDEDQLDDALAVAFGFDPDSQWVEMRSVHPEFWYVVSECHCGNDECGAVVGYGPRWYYNAAKNTYDAPRPLTPQEYEEAERRRQIRESGQQSFLEVQRAS